MPSGQEKSAAGTLLSLQNHTIPVVCLIAAVGEREERGCRGRVFVQRGTISGPQSISKKSGYMEITQ